MNELHWVELIDFLAQQLLQTEVKKKIFHDALLHMFNV